MTAKILVTGGAGFIGSEIVKQLSAHDEYEIRVLDALTKQIHGNNPEKSYLFQSIKDCCDFIRGDVRDFTTVQKALEGVDVVLHLAAETGTTRSMSWVCQIFFKHYRSRGKATLYAKSSCRHRVLCMAKASINAQTVA